MGAILVRGAGGRMGFVVFTIGIGAFVLGFVHPVFAPIALGSLAGGVAVAVALNARRGRSSRPTISHLAIREDGAPPRER